MSVFWKRIEFYKGKSDCKVIVFGAWGLGQRSAGLSWGIDLNIFRIIVPCYNSCKKIKN